MDWKTHRGFVIVAGIVTVLAAIYAPFFSAIPAFFMGYWLKEFVIAWESSHERAYGTKKES